MVELAGAEVPGSCGELVQGSIRAQDLLVSCPVNRSSRVWVTLYPGEGIKAPAGKEKTALAVRDTLLFFGVPGRGACVEVASDLPPGKGMGSSTADVTAAVYATAWALGVEIGPREVAGIALNIEPSDGSFLPGISLFDHRRGRVACSLGTAPPLNLVVADLGGEVDTLAFNCRPELEQDNRAKEGKVRLALRLVCRGLRTRDLRLVGSGATVSALAHQSLLPKVGLEELAEAAQDHGALGINIAHSGSLVAILLAPEEDVAGWENWLQGKVPGAEAFYRMRLVNGGVRRLTV